MEVNIIKTEFKNDTSDGIEETRIRVNLDIREDEPFSKLASLLDGEQYNVLFPQIEPVLGSRRVSYIIRNGKYLFDVDYSKCTVGEVLTTYQITWLEVAQPMNMGFVPVSIDPVQWIRTIFDILAIVCTLDQSVELSRRFKKWIELHLHTSKLTYTSLESLKKAIRSQDAWTLESMQDMFAIDSESAKVLLNYHGYIYSDCHGKYLYIPYIAKLNEQKMNRYINS